MLVAGAGAPGVINQVLPNAEDAGVAFFSLENDGDCNASNAPLVDWVTPSDANFAAFYQARVDVNSGAFTAGDATGAWLDLSATRTWSRTGVGSVLFTLQIREKGTGLVRTSQNLEVNVL